MSVFAAIIVGASLVSMPLMASTHKEVPNLPVEELQEATTLCGERKLASIDNSGAYLTITCKDGTEYEILADK